MRRRLSDRERVLRSVPESEFQRSVVEAAEALGWKMIFHDNDSRRNTAGLPDLILARERVVFAELKSETGRVSSEQMMCVSLLRRAGAEVYIWRPSDMDAVMELLKGGN